MPEITVRGKSIAYELWGQGAPVVMTPVAWEPRNVFSYIIAGRLSAHYRVLLWDRSNTGASDIDIEETPSELHLWSDVLHHLLQELKMSPAYVGGASNGSLLSLLMAHKYPEDVKGLILIDIPTDDIELMSAFSDARYTQLAEVAESKAMDAKRFTATLKKWGEWFGSEGIHRAHLTDEELAQITIPSLVFYGFDNFHPEHTAKEVAELLPNAELANYPPEQIQGLQDSDSDSPENAFLKLPLIEAFLHKVESSAG